MAGLPISIGSVGVRIVPDMRGFIEEISAYTKTVPDIRIGVEVDTATASLQLAALQEQVDHLSGDTAHVNVDVNGAGIAGVAVAVDGLAASVDDLTLSLDGAGAGAETAGAGAASGAGGFSMLGAAILGVIVLAGPVTAVLVPALFALATVLASVTAGFAVFAIAVIPVAKAVAAFRKEQLDPTTANLAALQRSLVGMPAAGRGLVMFVATQLYPAFQKIQRTAEKGLFPGLLAGLKAMQPLFPLINRFVGSLARTLGGLAAAAGKALNDKFWRGFFQFVASIAGPTLKTFAGIVGNIAHGLAAMMEGFGPATKAIGGAILGLSKSFANWASGKGFQDFLAYVKENGPPFAKLLGQLLVLVVNLLKAFAPLGPIIVTITSAIAGFLDSLNPTELLLIVAVVGSLVGGFAGVGIAVAAVAAIIIRHWNGIKSFFEGIGHWFSGPFVGFFTSMGRRITSAVTTVGHALTSIWNGVKSAATAVGHWFAGPFVGFFTSMGSKIHDAWNKVVSFLKSIPGKIKGFFKGAGTWLIKAGEAILGGLLTGLKSAWHHVTSFVSGIGGWISSHKGPIEVDRVLLNPHGQAIMQGLADGMKHKWPSVQDVVHAAGASIPQTMAAGITSTTPQVTAAMGNLSKAVNKELANLKSQLSSLRSDKTSLASTISSSLGGFDLSAAATTTDGTSGQSKWVDGIGWVTTPGKAGGATQFTGAGIASYLDNYAQQEQEVLHLLHKLGHGKNHLTKSQVSQFESEPISQSLPILQALNQATPAQLKSILADMASIQQVGHAVGKGQSQEVYDPQIAAVLKEIRALNGRVDTMSQKVGHVGGDVATALNGPTGNAKRKGQARAST